MALFGKRIELGTLFEDVADRGHSTTVHLSRPLDIAPGLGTVLDPPALAGLVRDAAGWFAGAGVKPGDRVAISKRDHWDLVLLCCAAARLGAVPVPLSASLEKDVLEILLKRLDPALLVVDAARLPDGRPADSGAARTLVLDRGVDREPGDGSVLSLHDVRGHTVPAPRRRPDDDPLAILHTSGTTGVPKLVVHSTRTLLRRLVDFEAHRWPVLAARPDDVAAAAFSFAHGRALAWTAAVSALGPAKMVVITSADWDEARPPLEEHRPTVMEAQPSTFVRWRPHSRTRAFDRVRLYVSTFDAVHPPTVRTFLDATRHPRPVWLQGWGQTETGPLTFRFFTRRAMRAERGRHPTTRDLGRPVPGRTRLRVVDRETLRPVPRGTAGLLACSTKALCLDYTAERERYLRKRAGRWFITGDLGVLTRGGRLLLLDRESDALPEASCVEVEDVIEDRLPGVGECVVLSVPGGRAQPVLVVEDGRLDPDLWRSALADLPELAEPVLVTWERMPRTATGKVRRAALREHLGLPPETHGTGRWT
ncbi:long-chain fatty acid--CoA ligase [Actinomadura sp. KC345]|uniref:class I adenylate-forming enzyme family protein n=1 Tax=Actinomadura sp. KC345 TaxID=2530371 RepID=UPI001052090A|nr:class I adenylate-forming enzyme family protein [Actinomadura sp. KC345]TDC58677.1 long-chain fatty acid--CoA ligase [Actinomadura sp. KC345]